MAVALIVAAGRGERLGSGRPKALVPLAGRPMVEWSVHALRAVAAVRQIVIALPPGIGAGGARPRALSLVSGAATRSHSVREALRACGAGDPVIVHDAARPLASPALFERVLADLEGSRAEAVIAATPVSDTIKELGEDGRTVQRTLERSRLWAVQTPAGVSPRGARARAAGCPRRGARGRHRRCVADRAARAGRCASPGRSPRT